MMVLSCFLGLLLAVAGVRRGDGDAARLPDDVGVFAPTSEVCGLFEHLRGAQTGFSWQYDGVQEPDFGAFAERFDFPDSARICAIRLYLAQVGDAGGQTCDLYLWSDNGGAPGEAVAVWRGIAFPPPTYWPDIGYYDVHLSDDVCVVGTVWAGYRGNWPGEMAPYFVVADTINGPGTVMTNVAPGIGYAEGWSNVSDIWGRIGSLGIALQYWDPVGCVASPVLQQSWGQLKGTYRVK